MIYLDSGCTINTNVSKRLKEYLDMIKTNDSKILSFQMRFVENEWTTKEILDSFGVERNGWIAASGQIMATVLIMQKCDGVIKIFKDCLDKIRKDPLMITDYYNSSQMPGFRENRHDQSFLSVTRKIHGSVIIPDETWSQNWDELRKRGIPFLATRLR